MGQGHSEKKPKRYLPSIALAICFGVIFGLVLPSIMKSLEFYNESENIDLLSESEETIEGKQPPAPIQTKDAQAFISAQYKVRLKCRMQKQNILHGEYHAFAELPRQILLSIDPDKETLRLGSLSGLSFERAKSLIRFSHSPGYLQKVQYSDNYSLNTSTGQLTQKITVPSRKQPNGTHTTAAHTSIYEAIFSCINL